MLAGMTSSSLTLHTIANPAPTPLPEISAAAVAQLRRLAQDQGKPSLKLRITVSGGGCSGFQYGFELDEVTEADDLVLEQDGASVLIDPLSLPYLQGATVDFAESLNGSHFVVRNPNATATCGCGSSFTA
jgi:iron-sulfur cluster insertion protein